MEERFMIPIMDFDSSWMMKGYESSLYALEYCEYTLGIPSECILEAFLGAEGLEVVVLSHPEVHDEVWYQNIKRLSKFQHAS